MSKSRPICLNCIVPNKKGLHARAAAQIVTISASFESAMTISHKKKSVSSLSLIKLLTLDAPQGSTIEISATGKDSAKASQAIYQLIENGFGE